MTAVEIVHIQPKPGTLPRLLKLRPTVIADYRARYPSVKAELYQMEDGSLIDIWIWESRAVAEEALADSTISAAFGEWVTLVEMLSLKWAEPLAVS